MEDSKTRFSDRVENYVKYRPHYPAALIEVLKRETGFTDRYTVADIGSGTGISSELFVENGNTVYAVEPNREMREAAEKMFAGCAGFHSVNGSAEQTTLDADSVDMLVSGQALHWFDRKKAHVEFARILKPEGRLVLFWNERKTDADAFQKEYDDFLRRRCRDYGKVTQKNLGPADIAEVYGNSDYQKCLLPNRQDFDFEALKGRLHSSSYSPNPGAPEYPQMIAALRELFERHSREGVVRFMYDTEIYIGKITD